MKNSQSKIQSPKSKIDWFLLSLLVFIPRLLDLDVFLTPDEPLFLEHAREFAFGLASGDFGQTLGIGYPGVTVAWWSAPVVGPASTELAAYAAGRFATALVTGLLLLILYAWSRLLLGRWPALFGVGLLALDPYTLAYSRLLHVAAPLALFMTLVGISFLLWLHKAHRRWLLLTGLFTGLALLTKSTALLLGPMLGFGLFGWSVVAGKLRQGQWWLRQLIHLLIVVLIATAIFFAFWPAMWIDPAGALELTFGKLLTDQEAGAGNLGLFWLGRFVENPGPAFYPVAFLLKSTPWLLVGLLLNLWLVSAVWRVSLSAPNTPSQAGKQQAARHNFLPTSVFFWLFALTYLLLMTIASKKSIRYMLPAFPVFYLLAGQAFYQIGKSANQQISRWRKNNLAPDTFSPWTSRITHTCTARRRKCHISRITLHVSRFLPYPQSLLSLLAVLTLTFFTLFYHPYYLTYYNPLLLGWRWAPHTLLVGWGEGLDQAARYLNQRPEANVAAWYEWLFPIFYRGPSEPVVPQENLITADRAVLYINQVQRDIPSPNIIHYFRTRRQPEYTVRLAGIDYAWVYPGPIAGFRPHPAPQVALGGDFGGEVRLLGYDLQPPPRSGQLLIVTLYWRVLATPPADRFVYLRLVDSQGLIWTRADSPPVMGLWPTTRWQPESIIEDAHELLIPPGTPPGTYRLEVGWYDPTSGQTLPASGQPIGQGGGLLLGEVQVEWQPSTAAPDLVRQTDTRLAPNARLIGYDPPPPAATAGDVLTIRLAWREAKTLLSFLEVSNDQVLFEWRMNDQRVAEQVDELPWPIEAWGRRATLLSQHQLIVPPALSSGEYELHVALHTGSDPAGETFRLGPIAVTAPAHQFDLPDTVLNPAGPTRLAQGISLAGYEVDLSAESLALQLYWQTEAPLTTRYKIFAQLLAADNTLAAQSDSFPAAGQRPTTGWLPGEIITDFHALPFPADIVPGNYRLIVGLYNPLTGERLPVLDDSGEIVADAISVAEIQLP